MYADSDQISTECCGFQFDFDPWSMVMALHKLLKYDYMFLTHDKPSASDESPSTFSAYWALQLCGYISSIYPVDLRQRLVFWVNTLPVSPQPNEAVAMHCENRPYQHAVFDYDRTTGGQRNARRWCRLGKDTKTKQGEERIQGYPIIRQAVFGGFRESSEGKGNEVKSKVDKMKL